VITAQHPAHITGLQNGTRANIRSLLNIRGTAALRGSSPHPPQKPDATGDIKISSIAGGITFCERHPDTLTVPK
jgi:hypothetical protein